MYLMFQHLGQEASLKLTISYFVKSHISATNRLRYIQNTTQKSTIYGYILKYEDGLFALVGKDIVNYGLKLTEYTMRKLKNQK